MLTRQLFEISILTNVEFSKLHKLRKKCRKKEHFQYLHLILVYLASMSFRNDKRTKIHTTGTNDK